VSSFLGYLGVPYGVRSNGPQFEELKGVVVEVVPYSFAGVPLLSLAGDFDHASVPAFTEESDNALGEDGRHLLLQLTDCPYIDSGGIGCLISSLRRVRDPGWLGVIDPHPDVLRVLKMVGLTVDPDFRVFASLEEVQAYLQNPGDPEGMISQS
jgi:stage II sporulation protein AA (anti-sigma F factor antagonist)